MTLTSIEQIRNALDSIITKFNWQIAYIGYEDKQLDFTTVAVKINRAKRKVTIRGVVSKVPGDERLSDRLLYDLLLDTQGLLIRNGMTLNYLRGDSSVVASETFSGLKVKDFQTYLDVRDSGPADYKIVVKYNSSHPNQLENRS